jgi:hypothetical protein
VRNDKYRFQNIHAAFPLRRYGVPKHGVRKILNSDAGKWTAEFWRTAVKQSLSKENGWIISAANTSSDTHISGKLPQGASFLLRSV